MKALLRVSAIVRTLYIRVKDLYEIVLSVSYCLFITFLVSANSKDDVLDAGSYARSMGMDRIEHFLAVKRSYDPEGLFQSALFQRIFTQDLEA